MVTRVGTGLSSGMDNQAIIEAILKEKQVPITRLDAQVAADQTKMTAWDTVKTKESALHDKTLLLNDYTIWRQMTAVASDTSVLNATATSGAAKDSYSIQVSTMAQSHTIAATAVTNTGTALNTSGDFTIGGKVVSIVASDTLTSIRDKINTAALGMNANDKVNSYIVDKTLVIKRVNTGSTAISISDGSNSPLAALGIPTSGTHATDPTHVLFDAQNLTGTVGGVAISSASNTGVTSILSGVTMNFTKVGASTLTINNDKESVKTLINDFITAYNDNLTYINNVGTVELSDTGTDVTGMGILQGDFLVASMKNQIRSIVGSQMPSPPYASGMRSLNDIGIKFAEDGTLSLDDTEKLDYMLSNSFSDVENLFRRRKGDNITDRDGIIRQLDTYLYQMIQPIEGSVVKRSSDLQASMDAAAKRKVVLQNQITDEETALYEHFARSEEMSSAINQQMKYLTKILGST